MHTRTHTRTHTHTVTPHLKRGQDRGIRDPRHVVLDRERRASGLRSRAHVHRHVVHGTKERARARHYVRQEPLQERTVDVVLHAPPPAGSCESHTITPDSHAPRGGALLLLPRARACAIHEKCRDVVAANCAEYSPAAAPPWYTKAVASTTLGSYSRMSGHASTCTVDCAHA